MAGKDDSKLGSSSADDEAAALGMPAEGENKFNAKKIIIFAILPLLVIGLGIFAAYFTGSLDGMLGKSDHAVDCNTVVEGDPDHAYCAEQLALALSRMAPGTFVEIPSMIVNLNATGKQSRFLKIALKVELEDKKDEQNFQAIMPRIIDQFQAYLRELQIDDLRGSSGMYRMKIELLSRIRAAAPEIKVRDVLFQEVLVQ